MLQRFSSAHAKSCITLLFWAHVLGVTTARTVVVDDSDTDKITYSKGWSWNRACLACTNVYEQIYNSTWHRHVEIILTTS